MSKNIETCKSEEVLASVTEQQPQDYPSVQQAVHDLGVTALPAASAADPDIEELPSNVEVFVRRVLKAVVYDRVLPVVQQMWQAVLNRISSPNYLPDTLLPYAQDPSLRTLGTLPTALSALSPRKISNGSATNDGIKDGMSLAHLLCEPASVVELKDDNYGWTLNRTIANLRGIFANLVKITLNCSKANGTCISNASIQDMEFPSLEEVSDASNVANSFIREIIYGYTPPTKTISVPKLRKIVNQCLYYTSHASAQTVEELEFPSLEYVSGSTGCAYCAYSGDSKLKRVSFPVIETCNSYFYTAGVSGTGLLAGSFSALEHIYIGYKDNTGSAITLGSISVPALWDVELKQGFGKNLNISAMNPTDKGTAFLENFLHHIAERLAVGPTTNRLTLTLSADVYSACGFGATIDDPTDIRYLIKKAIQDRNWKVTDGTNNFNQ